MIKHIFHGFCFIVLNWVYLSVFTDADEAFLCNNIGTWLKVSGCKDEKKGAKQTRRMKNKHYFCQLVFNSGTIRTSAIIFTKQ